MAALFFTARRTHANPVSEEWVRSEISRRFVPAQATVAINYDVAYRLLNLRLARMAKARVETTEGYWTDISGTNRLHVVVAEFRFHSIGHDKPDAKDGRVFLRDRMLSVLTMPDLDTLWYLRRAEQHIAVPCRPPRDLDYLDFYNLEAGSLSYTRDDYLANTVITNLDGVATFAEQGRGVSSVVKLMSEIYYGKREVIGARAPYRITANISGKIQPLVVTTSPAEAPVRLSGTRPGSLRVSVRRVEKNEKPGDECFTMWVSSFRDIAAQTRNMELCRASEQTPEWSMVPLVTDYSLALGAIRCTMTSVGVIQQQRAGGIVGNPPDTAPEMAASAGSALR